MLEDISFAKAVEGQLGGERYAVSVRAVTAMLPPETEKRGLGKSWDKLLLFSSGLWTRNWLVNFLQRVWVRIPATLSRTLQVFRWLQGKLFPRVSLFSASLLYWGVEPRALGMPGTPSYH
jgi:hypothetical protein